MEFILNPSEARGLGPPEFTPFFRGGEILCFFSFHTGGLSSIGQGVSPHAPTPFVIQYFGLGRNNKKMFYCFFAFIFFRNDNQGFFKREIAAFHFVTFAMTIRGLQFRNKFAMTQNHALR